MVNDHACITTVAELQRELAEQTMKRSELIAALTSKSIPTFEYRGKVYWLISLEREDGGGYKFNATVLDEDYNRQTIFIHTID
jgi:hypothetical protein